MSRSLGVLLVTILAAGCGDNAGLVPVAGVATVDGKPLSAGTVTFYPDAAKGNASPHQPVGLVEAGGKYTLTVPGGRAGAPLGWYVVVVYAVDDPQPGKPNNYYTHNKYADPKSTPLRLEVVAAPEPGRYDLELTK